jgi:outer membrane lipoprotein-sorting protein
MNTLDRNLELFAAREVEAAHVNEAQRKLEAAIASRTAALPLRKPLRQIGWLTLTASAAVAALLVWLPLASTPVQAFAEVQQHFRDFRTLRFDIDQRVNGESTMKSRVSVARDGNVRTDVGDDVSVIVNSTEQRILTLVHSAHVAVQSPLGAPVAEKDSLEWLKEIRDFQGQATLLPQSREIDGQAARGWELKVGTGNIVLWATEDGLPLEMTMDQEPQLQLSFHFEFDVALAPQLFSTEIPAGYSRAEAED